MSVPAAKKTSKRVEDACALFGVTADKIPNVLWALGLRSTCSRCAGSGRHSYNQIHGSICYGCQGRGEVSAKLTREVYATAVAKVEAGELEAARRLVREKALAKKAILPLVLRAKSVYDVIGQRYEIAYQAQRGSWSGGRFEIEIPAALFLAQDMNNALFYGCTRQSKSVTGIEFDVQSGRRHDYLACKADLEDAIAMLETLRDAWVAFEKDGAS